MNHLKNFQEYNQNEGLKELALGALLFITSCTNVSIHDKSGEKVSNPVQKEIKGKVASETTMTSKSGYYQIIKVNGEDGNTYDFKINQKFKICENLNAIPQNPHCDKIFFKNFSFTGGVLNK